MIRVSDYIIGEVAKYTDKVFLVTGGGAMHLNDAIGRNHDIQYICLHHEQSCAIAAESYARLSGKLGVINVTSGPGGINAMNGVFGGWVDSIPMLIVSGQVKRETCIGTYNLTGTLRQLGDQEADIINMIDGITKFSVFVDDPLKIKYYTEKAIYLALSGRPGPCWLDIPIDVQATLIDPEALEGYDVAEDEIKFDRADIANKIKEVVKLIAKAERPVIYAGSGIHHSRTYSGFFRFIDTLGVPVVTAWNSNDLLPDDHPLYAGRPGIIGNRPGNFAVQNSDLVVVLGSRLNIRLVSYNWENFARYAYKVCVDVDPAEMEKPTCKFDMKIHADLRVFFEIFLEEVKEKLTPKQWWIDWCKDKLAKYAVCLPEYWELKELVNPYCFVDEMSKHLKEDEIVVCADGTACVVTFQGVVVKKGQRIFHNSGCASMGYELPAAIGAYYSKPGLKRVICIAGDGSIMMNLQELQTIGGNNLPIQVIIFNNKGYHSIRQTQHNFFKDNIVGCGLDSGLTFPNFEKLAHAFNLNYYSVKNHDELKANLGNIMGDMKPFICEVFLTLDQEFSPKLSSKKLPDGKMISSPLEDMYPFLPTEELKSNMLVPTVN